MSGIYYKRKREDFEQFELLPPKKTKHEFFDIDFKPATLEEQLSKDRKAFFHILLPLLKKSELLNLCLDSQVIYEACADEIDNFYDGYFSLQEIDELGDPDKAQRFFYPKMHRPKISQAAVTACEKGFGTVLLTFIRFRKLDVNMKKYDFFTHACNDKIRQILLNNGFDLDSYTKTKKNLQHLSFALSEGHIRDEQVLKIVFPKILAFEGSSCLKGLLKVALADKNTNLTTWLLETYKPERVDVLAMVFRVAVEADDLVQAVDLYNRICNNQGAREEAMKLISLKGSLEVFSTLVWSDKRLLSPQYYKFAMMNILERDSVELAKFYFPKIKAFEELEPLLHAANKGAPKIFQLLLDEFKFPIERVQELRKRFQTRTFRTLCDRKIALSSDVNSVVAFQSAVDARMHELVEAFIKHQNIDPSMNNNWAVKCAAEHQDHKMLTLLLADSRVDVNCDNGFLAKTAHKLRDRNMMTIIARRPDYDCTADNNWTLRWALEHGKKRIIRCLLMRKEFLKYLSE